MRKLTIALILMTAIFLLNAESVVIGDTETGVRVLESAIGNTVLEFDCGSFERNEIDIDGNNWMQLHLSGETVWQERGYPALPRLNRAVIIPERAAMKIDVLESDYIELDMLVAPSKGVLSREFDPEETAYSFAGIYETDEYFPGELAGLGSPYIFRDYRGISVEINPFQYNGSRGILRIYTHLVIAISSEGLSEENIRNEISASISQEFAELYKRHFINFENERYVTIEEQAGRMVIISYGDFIDEMQPFIDWKNQKGIATTIVNVSTIGNNSTNIQNYIDAEYEADDGLVWVLLVGDAAQVATKTYSGAGGDPQYTYLDGTDCYSEIFIGRFSAETATQVETQVERSVYYESDVVDGDWMQKGVGIASSQGSGIGHYGEADYVHMGYIRDDLLDYGYLEVDEIYDTNGGNATMVANALNEGRGIINYCGHGSNTSWSTTGFNNTYVNALTNDNMLPFIQSIACVNGNFTSITCFAEAWLRATHGGVPTGAIAMFASSINQSWAPPMYAQDESIDLMCDEDLNTLGGLWFNGVSYMIDESNDIAIARTWHIFGDPSLQVRTKVPEQLDINCASTILFGQESYVVDVGITGALACLSYEGEILAQAYSGLDGSAYLFLGELPTEPVMLTLTVSGYNKITEIIEIQLVSGGGAYLQMMNYSISAGGDDVLAAGEFAELGITVINIGSGAAEDVEFTLFSDNEYITIIDGIENVPIVEINELLEIPACFSFSISEDALNGIPVIFDIMATCGTDVWNYSIGEIVEAEAGIISENEVIEMSMDLDENETTELVIKNNNYEGVIAYTVFINETTGTRNLTGSTMTCSAGAFTPGETVDWTFTCENNSQDWEWIKDIIIDFPDGVIVNSTTDFTGGSEDLEFLGDIGNGASCNWHGENTLGGFLHNGETALATVNVTITAGFIGDIELSWLLTGDDYGSEPHQVYGTIDLSTNSEPINWISIDQTSGVLEPGMEISHVLSFNTEGLESGIYSADILINCSENSLVIPVILYAGIGIIVYGDVDDNGFVESYDGSLILQYAVGLDPLGVPLPWEDWRIIRADVDGNDSVEAYDSALILQYFVGLITEFPVETEREHIAPYGEVDIRVYEESGTWLEFYIRGEAYSLEVMSRTNEFILGEPEIASGMLSAYNNANDLYRYALAGFEAINPAEACLRIPVQGYIKSGNLDISLKVNSYTFEETVFLGDAGYVAPIESNLLGNYPNPFNPETTIEYSLSSDEEVIIEIYNIRGQQVRQLVKQIQNAGYHQVVWDGRNSTGKPSGSGTYICLMRTSDQFETRKIVLIK